MPSNAISGVGTKFYRWGTGVWTRITEILSIQGPGSSREVIDVTNLDSEDGYREFIGSFRDGGDVQLRMNYTRAGYDTMKDDFDDDDRQYYQIVLPDGTSIEFAGLVQEVPLTINVGEQIAMDVVIKVSGRVVVNEGTGGLDSNSPGA